MPIISWYDDKDDNELIKLIPLLKSLSNCSDVRNELFKFTHNDLINWYNVEEYLEEINILNHSSHITQNIGFRSQIDSKNLKNDRIKKVKKVYF